MDGIVQQKFKEIRTMFEKLQGEICNTTESYYIWRTLLFSRSIVKAGKKKAEENTRLMGLYLHFFVLTEYNLLHGFILGINKFFDKKAGLSALIKKIQKYGKLFTPEVLLEIYPDRPFDKEEILKNYKPITRRDLSEIERWRKRSQDILKRLEAIRDLSIAHITFKPVDNITFKPKEIEKLISAIEKIFNKLYYHFNRTTTDFKHLKRDAERDTNFLLENLHRGEKQRSREIKKKWEL